MTNQLEELCKNQILKKKILEDEDKKSCLQLNQVLNFVECKNKKNQSKIMKTAFSMAKDLGMNPIWITIDQSLNLINDNKDIKYNVFILDSFKTELFDKLNKFSNYCSIYGPSCIFYCKNQFYLPIRKFPIFNLCMRNLEICLDEQFTDDYVKLFGLVTLMGGTLKTFLRPTTTHLISNNYLTDSAKYARQFGIPVIKKEWITDCWESSLSKDFNADDKSTIDKYRLPIFYRFHITTTQIDKEDKDLIKKLVTKYGGEFDGEFNSRKVTHLIVGAASGDKYKIAKNKNIHVMNKNWIEESVKIGYPLIEYDHLFDKIDIQTPDLFDFTPYKNILTELNELKLTQSQLNSQSTSKFINKSQIVTQPNSEIITQFSTTTSQSSDNANLTTKNQQSSQIITQLQEDNTITNQSQEPATQIQTSNIIPLKPNPAKTYCVKSKNELEKEKTKNAFSLLTSSQSKQNKSSTTNIEEELNKLLNSLSPNCKSSIFDGCDFYLFDNNTIQQNVKNLLKRCITLQNGTISIKFRQSVTHCILKDNMTDLERKKLNEELDKFDHNVKQVDIKWIIQCSKTNKLLPSINQFINSNLMNSNDLVNISSFSQPASPLLSKFNKRKSRLRSNRNSSVFSQPISQSIKCTETRSDNFLDDYIDQSVLKSKSNLNYQQQSTEEQNKQLEKYELNSLDLDMMRREEKPLYKCILTISSYPQKLKEELTKIAERLGATCQIEFVKTNKLHKNKFRNTHLVCDDIKSNKYEKALEWGGIFTVNQKWLRDCERFVKRLDENDYDTKNLINLDQTNENNLQNIPLTKLFSNNLPRKLTQSDTNSDTGSIVSDSTSMNPSSLSNSQITSELNYNPALDLSNTNLDKLTSSMISLSDTMQSKMDNLKTIFNDDATESDKLDTTIIPEQVASKTTITASATVTSTTIESTTIKTIIKDQSKEAINNKKTKTSLNGIEINILNDKQRLQLEEYDDEQQLDQILDQQKIEQTTNNLMMPNLIIGWNDQKSKYEKSFSLPSSLKPGNKNLLNKELANPTQMTSYSDDSIIRNRLINKDKVVDKFDFYEDSTTTIDDQSLSIPENKNCKINFIGYLPHEKQLFSKELAKLNIKVNENYDLDFNYLITHDNKLTKNECFFVSISMGKWIVHPDFYKKILEIGKIPNPLEYEWGSNEKYLQKLDSRFVQLARSCRYWRLKVKNSGKFAFDGQKLIIVSVNAMNYASIIKNGGGIAITFELKSETKENYKNVLTELYNKLKNGKLGKINYILINFKKTKRDELELLKLIKPIEDLNYTCLTIDYLSLYLVSDSNLKINNVRINPLPSPKKKRPLDNYNNEKQTKIAKR